MLTDRYLHGVPEGSRAAKHTSLSLDMLSKENIAHVSSLAEIAGRRGQRLSQMAIAWALRDSRVTSVLIGASSVEQLDENLGALDNLDFSTEELSMIDAFATEGHIDLWRSVSED